MRRRAFGPILFAALAAVMSCGSPSSPTPPGGCTTNCGPTNPPVIDGSGTLVGAGDIAVCDGGVASAGTVGTAKLLDSLGGPVFTAGDNAYFDGSPSEFANCYHPTWGRHKDRTRPVPGNHDYHTSGAAGYFSYFGDAARGSGEGYYKYQVGPWTIFALNSEIPIGAGSAQLRWLRDELKADTTRCTMAIWHRPLFTSGPNRDNPDTRELWRALYEFKADVIVNGHDHLYERFTAQDPDGRADPGNGIRQFTVGTGGASLYDPVVERPNSRRVLKTFGVIQFTLSDGNYSWRFIPVDPTAPGDSGTESCH